MYGSSNFRIISRLGFLIVLVACLWQFSGGGTPAQEPTDTHGQLAVRIIQLPSENGIIPVEIKCGKAELSDPNSIENIPCVAINNTSKAIKAFGVSKAVITESNGERTVNNSTSILDAFVHPDVNAERGGKLIPPGKEVNVGGLPTSYGEVIKGIGLKIDYAEFDDGTELGPDEASSKQRIADVRAGAAKYKQWLVQQLSRSGQDINAITPLLEREPPDEEIKFENNSQEEGAILYRNYALKVKDQKGINVLAERLKSTDASK